MSPAPDRDGPLKLTLRFAALLHAIRYGKPPWFDDDEPEIASIKGAVCTEPGEWTMCCGFVYSDEEIEAMERAGWIRTDGPLDSLGRKQTTAGANITAAWNAPYYDPEDPAL